MICLVTDRRRLAGAGAGPVAMRACLVAQARRAVEAGVDLIQVRERDLDAGALAGLVAELLSVTSGSDTRLIVNDRLDVALAAGADGVHLRGDSIPIREARRLAPEGFLIGRSVHEAGEAAAAAAADYLIAGTVFPTASKAESAPLLGIEGLRAIVRTARPPVLAIGGMAGTRLAEAAAAGAAGIAAIGLFIGSHPDPELGGCQAADLRQTVNTARSWFDRLNITP
jgi:thiamine-phosphate pyrophosphorylase